MHERQSTHESQIALDIQSTPDSQSAHDIVNLRHSLNSVVIKSSWHSVNPRQSVCLLQSQITTFSQFIKFSQLTTLSKVTAFSQLDTKSRCNSLLIHDIQSINDIPHDATIRTHHWKQLPQTCTSTICFYSHNIITNQTHIEPPKQFSHHRNSKSNYRWLTSPPPPQTISKWTVNLVMRVLPWSLHKTDQQICPLPFSPVEESIHKLQQLHLGQHSWVVANILLGGQLCP